MIVTTMGTTTENITTIITDRPQKARGRRFHKAKDSGKHQIHKSKRGEPGGSPLSFCC